MQAYKTDANGLPFLDGSYNNPPLVSATTGAWTGTVDPRLDWAVGRPGKPYFDWGIIDTTWIRDQTNAAAKTIRKPARPLRVRPGSSSFKTNYQDKRMKTSTVSGKVERVASPLLVVFAVDTAEKKAASGRSVTAT